MTDNAFSEAERAAVYKAIAERRDMRHFTGGSVAVLRPGGSQHRHKRLAECAFGKQAAKQIGNAKRDVKSVGQGAGAKQRRQKRLAHQAGNA